MFFGGLSATGQAYNENAINKLNKKSFALSEYLVNSEDARKIYAAKLRNEIQSGKITKKEASKKLRAIRQMAEVYKQLPSDLTTRGRQ